MELRTYTFDICILTSLKHVCKMHSLKTMYSRAGKRFKHSDINLLFAIRDLVLKNVQTFVYFQSECSITKITVRPSPKPQCAFIIKALVRLKGAYLLINNQIQTISSSWE